MKRCPKCAQVKPLDQFTRDRSTSDGLAAWCRTCNAAKARRRREANPQATRDGWRRWHEANPETTREAQRKADRRYYQANRHAILASNRQYQAELKARVLAHYGTTCACCGTTERLSIDHIGGGGSAHREELFGRPRCTGGGRRFYAWLIKQDLPDGYQTLCVWCNRSKASGERCILRHEPLTDAGYPRQDQTRTTAP